MEKLSKFEFDCPQFVDFNNVDEDSNAELFFETAHDYSPRLSTFTRKPSETRLYIQEVGNEANKSPGFDGPFRNTRLSKKKYQEIFNQEYYPVKSTQFLSQSSCPQQIDIEQPAKKARKEVDLPQTEFKKPFPKGRKLYMNHTLNSSRREALSRRSEVEPHLKSSRRLNAKQRLSLSECATHRTIPAPFSFQTDMRLKSKPEPNNLEYKPLDFVATLRSNRAAANAQLKSTTGPVRAVPERLLRKRKLNDCRTMAEEVLNFQHVLSTRAKPSTPKGGKENKKGRFVTQPITPHFRAAARSRPLNVLSHEQKEILEAQEMKKYHFKARPIDPKLFVPFGLKPREPIERPKLVPMSLETERRAVQKPRSRSLDQKSPTPEFHARPVPRKILQGVTGLGKRVVTKPTKAHTPPFELNKREENWKEHARQQEKAEAAAAAMAVKKPARSRSHDCLVPVSVTKEPLKKTLPAPFSFHERDLNMLSKKEEKIQQILQQETKPYQFQARPMPSPSVSGIPQRLKAPSTVIDSFSMDIDQRARNRASRWQQNMDDEMKRQKESIMFKAQPCTVTSKEPFIPAKANKPPTEIAEFSLYTEGRAADREKYDEQLTVKEIKKLEELERRKLEEEMEAKLEVAELRAKAVHKANPVPEYRPFEVKRNLIPVTQPVTPKFETDYRLRNKKL